MTESAIITDLRHCIDRRYTTIVPRSPSLEHPFTYDDDRNWCLSCTVACVFCPYSYESPRWCSEPIGDFYPYISALKPFYPELFI